MELENELEMLKAENEEKMHQVETASNHSEYLEARLISLREEEQRIIQTAGGSYSILQEYERRIKVFQNRKDISRENLTISKRKP